MSDPLQTIRDRIPGVGPHLKARLSHLSMQFKTGQVLRPRQLVLLSAWLLPFLLVSLLGNLLPARFLVFLFIGYVFLWFRLTDMIVKQLRPPAELVVVVLMILFWLEFRVVAGAAPGSQPAGIMGLLTLIQSILLALMILLMGVVLVQGSGGKKGILLFCAGLGAVIFYFLHKDAVITTRFFELILLLVLISKTSWLEELTRTSCWIYWIGAIICFALITGQSPLWNQIPDQLGQALLWQKIPFYLYLLLKIYLLVLIIKIPVVLVYNHARLSRKLKIASLFQSAFPQFMQLTMLLIVFYFFISGWQAERFRETLEARLQAMIRADGTGDVTVLQPVRDRDSRVLNVPGFHPVEIPGDMRGYRVLGLTPVQADSQSAGMTYFLHLTGETGREHLVHIDARLLQSLAVELPVLAGSQLQAYPFTPGNRLESVVYRAHTRSLGRLSRIFPLTLLPYHADNLHVFPFTILPHAATNPISFDLAERKSGNFLLDLGSQGLQRGRLAVGRLFMPLTTGRNAGDNFFAFDIVLIPNLAFATSLILRLLLFLSLIYMAVNFLVTRQMINFGEHINRLVVNRFNQVRKGIRAISAGNLDYKIELEGEDEFVELADRFNHMAERLQQTVAESVEKERLQHELGIARRVQLSLLPRELPEIRGYQLAGSMQTATEVGGDFYDVLPMSSNKFLITIGDVSGKGSSAALYMAQCVSLIRFAHQFSEDPAEIAVRLNNYFSDPMVDRQTFVTAILGVLDVKRNHFRFVRAGHTYPVLIPADERQAVQELKSAGVGIGIAKGGSLFEEKLEVHRQNLRLNDTLVLYSDGLVEAAKPAPSGSGDDGGMAHYGDARLNALLQGSRHESAAGLLAAIEADIASFYQDQAAVDDHTVVVIRRTRS